MNIFLIDFFDDCSWLFVMADRVHVFQTILEEIRIGKIFVGLNENRSEDEMLRNEDLEFEFNHFFVITFL